MPMSDNDQDNKPLHGPNLILDVENFGPIAEAKNIEFRPMMVFVGPSNTGKSYLAMLLHAILKAKNGDFLRPNAVPPSVINLRSATDQSELIRIVSEVRSFVETVVDRRSSPQTPIMKFETMSTDLQSFVSSATKEWLASLATRTVVEVERYFQRRLGDLVTSNSNCHLFSTSIFTDSRKWLMTFSSDTMSRAAKLSDVNLIIDSRPWNRLLGFDNASLSSENWVELIIFDALNASINRKMDAFVRSHYAPAGRTGILASRAVLTSAIIANLDRFGVDSLEIGRLNPISAEFLSSMSRGNRPARYFGMTLNRPVGQREDGISRVADVMESELLHGEIVQRDANIDGGSYYYVTENFQGALATASSMVTEIAPLILLIRNEILQGDLLIIDEPEAHLHPAAQQKMAAMLAYMIRRGMRVLITTHSHYFVEQLGALVNAGADSVDPSERERHLGMLGRQIDRDLYLKQEEVAVYEFEPHAEMGAASKVTELPFDGDYMGYYPSGYSKALTDQRNRNVHMIGAREGF